MIGNQMGENKRPVSFWIFIIFLGLSILLMLVGQTMSVFDYELTVQLGLQESQEQVGSFGVQVNRAFGASDTIIYIPLLIGSLVGLIMKKQWALLITAAVAGISVYWSSTIIFIFLFSSGTFGYNYIPGLDIWLFVSTYTIFGIWSISYLIFRGNLLIK
jgi:hypothetical protein